MVRPPIVTVLGHVDHGKTTLLDALRGTRVASRESGGITQHIGASQIEYKKHKITFIDTPGHEAFSQMRSRGGKVADIAIIVVAANDGIKPQTLEAIEHARAHNVPIIVAITKIDLEGVVLNKVKKQLYDAGLVLEEFGGDVICVEVSATKNKNLDKLLDSILALSSMLDIKESDNTPLKGFVIESMHDARKGYVANVIVQSGVLKIGQTLFLGKNQIFKIRSIFDAFGKVVKQVESGSPCQILGLKELAGAGDVFEDYKDQTIQEKDSPEMEIKTDEGHLNVILKADTVGTLEALQSSISKLSFEDKTINLVLKAVGDVKESDVTLASATNSIVVAFKSRISSQVTDRAKELGVIVRVYEVIYNLIQELQGALEGVFEVQEERVKGRAEVLKMFPLGDENYIAGCRVTHGRLKVGDSVEVLNEDNFLFKDKIKTIKISSQKTDIIGKDKECGVLLAQNSSQIREGYIINVL